MTYQTPSYDYSQQTAALAKSKGLEDVARDYGRFLGQESFRRAENSNLKQFTQGMPKVGTHFNRRGMWNSGLRQQGQQRFAGDFQEARNNLQFDQAAQNTQFDMAKTNSDAQYQQALLDLYERLQVQRAAGYDPFQALR